MVVLYTLFLKISLEIVALSREIDLAIELREEPFIIPLSIANLSLKSSGAAMLLLSDRPLM